MRKHGKLRAAKRRSMATVKKERTRVGGEYLGRSWAGLSGCSWRSGRGCRWAPAWRGARTGLGRTTSSLLKSGSGRETGGGGEGRRPWRESKRRSPPPYVAVDDSWPVRRIGWRKGFSLFFDPDQPWFTWPCLKNSGPSRLEGSSGKMPFTPFILNFRRLGFFILPRRIKANYQKIKNLIRISKLFSK